MKTNNTVLASILGYLHGDGRLFYRKQKGRTNYEIAFFPDTNELAKDFIQKVNTVFGKEPRIYDKNKKQLGCVQVRCFSKPVYEKINSMGMFGTYSWRIPEWVLLEKENSKEWLKSYFDSEAHVSQRNKCIQLKSVNEYGIKQVSDCLSLFGIKNKVYGPYNYKKTTYFTLQINKDYLKKYRENIGFNHDKKRMVLDDICAGMAEWHRARLE